MCEVLGQDRHVDGRPVRPDPLEGMVGEGDMRRVHEVLDQEIVRVGKLRREERSNDLRTSFRESSLHFYALTSLTKYLVSSSLCKMGYSSSGSLELSNISPVTFDPKNAQRRSPVTCVSRLSTPATSGSKRRELNVSFRLSLLHDPHSLT